MIETQLIKPIIAGSTMLGKNNCFSLVLSEEPFAETKIVNMTLEDFESEIERLQDKVLISFLDDSKKWAIVNDKRIDYNLLMTSYCTICCPQDLCPEEQKEGWREAIKNGDIVESKIGNISIVSFKPL